MFGEPVLRSEDPRFLRGEARYLENLAIPGALRAVFVRSMMPHARLSMVDAGAAMALPGVVAVFLAEDLAIPPMPPSGMVEGASGHLTTPFLREVLARDRVRFVGDPIALVVADDLATAEDGAESVVVDLDPFPPVTDPVVAASEAAPVLFPEVGTNVAHTFESSWDVDVLAGAEVTARGRFVNQRLAPVPMEGNGIVVVPEDEGRYTVWVSTQVPFDVRADLADLLGVDKIRGAHDRAGRGRRVRCEAPDLPGVPRRGSCRPDPGPPRPLVGEPHRKHALADARPCPGPGGRDRGAARRDPGRDARRALGGHGCLPDRCVPADHDAGDAQRRLRVPGDRVPRAQRRDERHPGRPVPGSGPPRGDGSRGACDRPPGRRDADGSGGTPSPQPDPARRPSRTGP